MVQRLGGDGPANGHKCLLCLCDVSRQSRSPPPSPQGDSPWLHAQCVTHTHTSHILDTEGDSLRMIVLIYIYIFLYHCFPDDVMLFSSIKHVLWTKYMNVTVTLSSGSLTTFSY